jgi:hypothetical protein
MLQLRPNLGHSSTLREDPILASQAARRPAERAKSSNTDTDDLDLSIGISLMHWRLREFCSQALH